MMIEAACSISRRSQAKGVLLYGDMIDDYEALSKIGHEKKVIGLTQDYGYRLSYWGLVDSIQWMSSADFSAKELSGKQYDMRSLFADEVEGQDVFVVTQPEELDHQPELKSLLTHGYAVLAEGDGYTLYDLHHPLK
jgi:hypothetical protein